MMAADAPPHHQIVDLGRSLDAAFPGVLQRPRHAAEDRLTARLAEHPELRAGLFRLVDVAPACRTPRELADHLGALLDAPRLARTPLAGRAARLAVRAMAGRFIVGRSPQDAAPALRGLWERGVCSTVALLGE